MRDSNTIRTTLDIDDDVLLAVKTLSRQQKTTAGQLLSQLARKSLSRRPTRTVRNGVPLFAAKPGARMVTMELVNRLRDEDGA